MKLPSKIPAKRGSFPVVAAHSKFLQAFSIACIGLSSPESPSLITLFLQVCAVTHAFIFGSGVCTTSQLCCLSLLSARLSFCTSNFFSTFWFFRVNVFIDFYVGAVVVFFLLCSIVPRAD